MTSKVLAKIKELQNLEGNAKCTDCDSEDVSWAVINHGFFVCVQCAGAHRHIGVEYSQVRSTELDVGCWDEKLFTEFRIKGNKLARKKFEKHVPAYFMTPRECPNPLVRKYWIETKYVAKQFENEAGKVLMPEQAMLGWLMKCNDAGRWQKRYCVAYRNKLMYFKESSQSLPTGTIELAQATVTIPDRELGGGRNNKAPPCERYRFNISSGGRVYTFAPETLEELFKWIHVIRRSSLFYGESKNVPRSLPQVNEAKGTYAQISKKAQKEGQLGKQGGSFMSWKQRWCVLSSNTLYYFKSTGPPKPGDNSAGSIPIVLCDVADGAGKIKKPNAFCLITTTRTFFFQAPSSMAKTEWIGSLKKSAAAVIEQIGSEVDFSKFK
mmetsp:Transcript_3647/g.4887  ORF Transcript_3647/g.4887 Transcript_3647/m.4887 type:complete len:380 (-) Transcript_3647:358-1497(-)